MRGFWISRVIGRELFLVRIQVFRAGLREAWIGDGAKRGECRSVAERSRPLWSLGRALSKV